MRLREDLVDAQSYRLQFALSMRGISSLFGASVLLLSSGCGLIAQTAVGWHDTEKVIKPGVHHVRVTSEPEGAQVIRRDNEGVEVPIGIAPLDDQISIQMEETVESSNAMALLIGGLIDAGLATAMFAGGAGNGDPAGTALLFSGGTLIALFAIPELIVALAHGASSDRVIRRQMSGGPRGYVYLGKKSGLPDAIALVKVPDQSRADLALEATLPKPLEATAVNVAASLELPVSKKPSAGWVVAVMDVEDLNSASKDKAVEPGLVQSLSDQIRIFVAQRGIRTIDRSAQERAFREQVESLKKESYKECYDDSCQIDLGKALAASHILRARIARFGARCVLNAELIDLRAEVTVSAASTQGDCEAEGFLNMSDSLATKLFDTNN